MILYYNYFVTLIKVVVTEIGNLWIRNRCPSDLVEYWDSKISIGLIR